LPDELHSAFDPESIRVWDPSRFRPIRKLQHAVRNHGEVHLMQDWDKTLVAVKCLPLKWMRRSHNEFLQEHPEVVEWPWQDLGALSFLEKEGRFPYLCRLQGVYADDTNIFIVTDFVSDGDLLTWALDLQTPVGPDREAVCKPVVVELLKGFRQLHDLSVSHMDISCENLLKYQSLLNESPRPHVKIIDYGMCTNRRFLCGNLKGKAAYQAPELHRSEDIDTFLCDSFSLGVVIYALLLQSLPWSATGVDGCKFFEHMRDHGFDSFSQVRKVNRHKKRVCDALSQQVSELLKGMLSVDPETRLTLGESCWPEGRASVWDTDWLQESQLDECV